MRTNTRRPGFALAVALFAMVVIGALIAGAFFASTQEFRIGRNTLMQTAAMTVADAGQAGAIAGWDNTWNGKMKNGDVIRVDTIGPNWELHATITRLNQTTFWLVSEGTVTPGSQSQSRRRTGMVLRLAMPMMNFKGGLTTRGAVTVGGSSEVSGFDTNPVGWNDCPIPDGSTDKPGVVVDNAADVVCKQAGSCVGNPPTAVDPTVDDTTLYFDYGNTDWAQMTAGAKMVTPGSFNRPTPSYKPDGSCNTADLNNWGDPRRSTPAGACESYFPIIYAPGDLLVNGDYGQGVLLVEGNMDVQGNMQWAGPVIVRGRVELRGTGGVNSKFTGGIMAADVLLDSQSVSGNATVMYSRCALLTALANSSFVVPADERAWTDLY